MHGDEARGDAGGGAVQDELPLYRHMQIYSLEDARKQLAKYQRQSNDYIMTYLGIQSPDQVLVKYADVIW